MKSISIIMPSYNDAKTILASLKSVEAQSLSNWELIIVNDGSTDNSLDVIKGFISQSPFKTQYQVISQENQDQLLAIQNGAKHAKGDYIYILHSDDLLYNSDSLKRFLEIEAKHSGFDAYTGSRYEMDDNEQLIREVKTLAVLPEAQALALTYLWLGRNIYMDVAFFERQAFNQHVSKTYLSLNMPYWIYFTKSGKIQTLKLYNMDFPLLRYRVHSENYANSRLGAANVLSGELRCLLSLASSLHIPAYRAQFILFRILNKLRPNHAYRPFFRNYRQKRLSAILELVFEKAMDSSLRELAPFATVLNFFKVRDAGKQAEIATIAPLSDNFRAPQANQMRAYNQLCISKNLSSEHLAVLKTIAQAAATLKCQPEDASKLQQYLIYLGLAPYVQIEPSISDKRLPQKTSLR